MTGLAKIRLVRESRSCWEAQFCPGERNVQGAWETAVPAPMGEAVALLPKERANMDIIIMSTLK